MHEFHLMAGLMRKIESIAREHHTKKVTRIKVKLGAFSHISPEHFREHFTFASRGTLAEGSVLEIEACNDPEDPHAQEILLENVEVEAD